MQKITPEQLQERLQQDGPAPVLLDVREDWEFERCHIDNSVHIPMNQIAGEYDQLDEDTETVVICHHGMRSLQVAQYLEAQGFSNIANLDGGIDAWAKTVDPDMEQY